MTKTAKAIIPLGVIVGLAAAACSTSPRQVANSGGHQGVLTGQLSMEGGPPVGGNPRPISGRVAFIEHGRVVATDVVGADGRFSQALRAGSYQVRACTSRIQQIDPNGPHIDACESIQALVAADRTKVLGLPYFIVP